MKSEPSECSIDDLVNAPNQTVPWLGVGNYQARNFMRDAMKLGDAVLFYHSSCQEPGIVGLAVVASHAYPDLTQFDACSSYFDPMSPAAEPRWLLVDLKLVRKTRLLSLTEMRAAPVLETMPVLRRVNRLSITPVTVEEERTVLRMLKAG